MRKFAVLAMALALLGACRDQTVTVLPRSELPKDIYDSPAPTQIQGAEMTFQLFFVRGNRLEPARRTSRDSGSLEVAISLLLEGTTAAEQQSGIASAIPSGVELLSARVSADAASINLTSEFETEAEQEILLLRLAQVVFTATAIPGIDRVRFMIDGEPGSVLIGDGTVVSRAVARSDYSSLTSG